MTNITNEVGWGWQFAGTVEYNAILEVLTVTIEAAWIDEDGYLTDIATVEEHTVNVEFSSTAPLPVEALLPHWEWESVVEDHRPEIFRNRWLLGGMRTCREVPTTPADLILLREGVAA